VTDRCFSTLRSRLLFFIFGAMAKAKTPAKVTKRQTHSKAGNIQLETRLSKQQQLELFRWMVLNREFDNKISLLYRRGLGHRRGVFEPGPGSLKLRQRLRR
jgi:hypothetical protein